MACMRANIPKTLTVKDVQLDASDANGRTRTMKGKLYATRDDDKLRAVIRISAPGDLAGASYLLRERDNGDEMYVYRSEEHTSELQSLMRISYAVFCLKKKTQQKIHLTTTVNHSAHHIPHYT